MKTNVSHFSVHPNTDKRPGMHAADGKIATKTRKPGMQKADQAQKTITTVKSKVALSVRVLTLP